MQVNQAAMHEDLTAAFDIPGDTLSVLCIHGLTGTPHEMRYLAEQLHSSGWTAVAPRLPGHGTQLTDLNSTTWNDWIREVETTFDTLKRRGDRVAVVGQSLGSLLALELATRRPGSIHAVATLATPLWLPTTSAMVARGYKLCPALTKWVPYLPKKNGMSDVADPVARSKNPGYRVIPAVSLVQLTRLMDRVRRRLEFVRVPLLVLHGLHDHTAPPDCAPYLMDHVSSQRRRLRLLSRSYHVLSIDRERDIVAREVRDFFKEGL